MAFDVETCEGEVVPIATPGIPSRDRFRDASKTEGDHHVIGFVDFWTRHVTPDVMWHLCKAYVVCLSLLRD